MTTEIKTIADIISIVRRRKWELLLPALAIFLVAVVVASLLPRTYRSKATILIEAQEVPTQYVKANMNSYADQRLQAINQQIMGAPRLLELISRFNLYPDLRNRQSMDEIVEKMRKDIKFTPISADVVDSLGRPAQVTLAFSVAFQGSNPEVVQKLTSELASLFLAENMKGRDRQSAGTSKFLHDEMKSIQRSLAAIEARVAAYKQRNIEALPELSQVNMQAFEQVDREIRGLNDQLRAAQEKEEYLQNQLANVPSQEASNDRESLRQLKLTLADLTARFSNEYPDVKKTRLQIEELETRIRTKEKKAEQTENPAYVTLASQLAGTRSDLLSLKRQIASLVAKRDGYQRRIQATPRVEEGYKAILVERNNLQQKYDDLAEKAMEANVAHGMEKEQLGERFTIVDPPRVPTRPATPNIPAILLIGLVLGVGSGVALAAFREAADDSFRRAEHLASFAGLPVLATLPEIVTAIDLSRQRRKALSVSCLAALVAVIGIHLFVMDITVLWSKLGRLIAEIAVIGAKP